VGNTGFSEVTLRDVGGRTVDDSGTEFTFVRMPGSTQMGDIHKLDLPPNPHRFEVPAFPQAHAVAVRIGPLLYRSWESSTTTFTLADGQTLHVESTVARRPQRWQARFTRWNGLPATFSELKQVLEASPTVLVADNPSPRPFSSEAFDDVDDDPSILAKASLLNLYAKMSLLVEPVADQLNWFSFVRRILRIARARDSSPW
jgi:hypothetical protein